MLLIFQAWGNAQYYNGMISAVKWSAASPANTAERSFKYSYDKLYRLTASVYQEKNSLNGLWGKNQDAFNETLSYDENGNILTLLRKAVISSTVTTIDDLTYSYKDNDFNNRLENINDAVSIQTAGYGYRNFTGTGSSTPYSHDDNGNLTGDLKKGTTITYNELNKPTLIQISSTKKVEYHYDAAGTRVSKIVTNNSTVKTIEYIGGYVIENDILSYYSMAEGRVRNDGDNLGYNIIPVMEYCITDHQGNTRVSFEDNSGNAALIQENSYYAFGMQMAGSTMPGVNPNKKLYNAGSEWQDDIDGLADYYSTFFREYDAVIGRFNGVDPMSESFESWTTYHYSYNNPVNFNDPKGDRAASSFESPRDLLEYVMLMGVNSVDFGAGNNAYYMNWWGGGGGYSVSEAAGGVDHKKIEEEVVEILTKAGFSDEGKKNAYKHIIKSYGLNQGFENKYWVFVRNGEESYTDETDKDDIKGQGVYFKTSFSSFLLDMLSPERKEKYQKDNPESNLPNHNFGDIVRTVYHEITVHGGDIISGLKKRKDVNSAEREFRGYYGMYSNSKDLPSGNMKFYYWSKVVMASTRANNIKAAPDGWTLQDYQAFIRQKSGSYSDINKNRQNLYKQQNQEMIKYVFSVFYQFK